MEDAMTLDPVFDPNKAAVLPVYVTFIQGLTGKPEAVGWISIHLGTGLQQDTLQASDAFPPFDDLVSFLVRIALGPLPAGFELGFSRTSREMTSGRESGNLLACLPTPSTMHLYRLRASRS
jgi:hypothetical protein